MKTKISSITCPLISTLACASLLALLPALPAFAAPGDLDPLDLGISGSIVLATAVQPDGKTIIAGTFTQVLGVPRSNIARINADGTLDTGFNPYTNDTVHSVAVQTDGKVLPDGGFATVAPGGGATVVRNYIARVNASGTLDAGFNPNPSGTVLSVAVQAPAPPRRQTRCLQAPSLTAAASPVMMPFPPPPPSTTAWKTSSNTPST